MTREIPADIATYPFDVIVIGAGINGAGIARDAALRGLLVLLVDKGDIGGGTTSWSTRLIHGGLRYLEHAEIGLVRESLRERERLLRLAPHLVRPLPLIIPLYRHDRRGPWLIHAGMLAYDVLSFDKSLPRHRMLSREETLRRLPGLNPEGLLGAALYRDAQVEYPERLTLENVLSARGHGAVVLTYARVERLLREGRRVTGIGFSDALGTGRFEAHAPVTVNVAGPWVDEVLQGTGSAGPLIGGTKGSHVIVAPFPGAPTEALYVEARADRRPFFIIPWNGLLLIGTTDIRYRGDLDRVEASEAEIAYLLAEANRVLPQARLDRDAVLATYSGVRPLPYTPSGTEAAITRRHIVHDHRPELEGLISIVGGKLTTYRSLAQEAVDLAFRKLGRWRRRSVTGVAPLPGALSDVAGFARRLQRESGLSPAITGHLVRVYGGRSLEVLEMAAGTQRLLEPLGPSGTIAAEIPFAFRAEIAQTLGDALLRRTMAGLATGMAIGVDEAAAEIARRELGWDGERVSREIAAYRANLERFRPRTSAPV